MSRRRILFIGEAATMAHVGRPIVLAKALNPEEYEIFFACDARSQWMLPKQPWTVLSLPSMPQDRFLECLAKGNRAFDIETLRSLVRNDIELLKKVRPSVVVGDFRPSLSISSKVVGIPYVAITNAYWSPHCRLRPPVPDHLITRIFGAGLGQFVFNGAKPIFFWWHSRPFNEVRKEYGLPSLGSDLRRNYSEADYTLYPDHPESVPMENLSSRHLFLGLLPWSMETPLPAWWSTVPDHRPRVLVNLGSSGDARVLDALYKGLMNSEVTVMWATCKRNSIKPVPGKVFITDYFPSESALEKADVMINNGGVAAWQAMRRGVPVVGIASNMDQHFSFLAIEKDRAGIRLRSESITPEKVQAAVKFILNTPAYADNARVWSQKLKAMDGQERFRQFLKEAKL